MIQFECLGCACFLHDAWNYLRGGVSSFAEIAEEVSILYGGSCKPGNAKEIFANKDVDGGLIGGASLKAEDFVGIITAFN